MLGLTVLVSITLHGVTVTPAMRWLDRRRRRQGCCRWRRDADALCLVKVQTLRGGPVGEVARR
ncbi:hypothetical protein ACFQU2_19835 [Siccirubricoccus deserti]